jgi:ribosomal protein L11 methyltransferase
VSQSWSQLTVHTRAADIDAFANFLIERGAPGVVIKKRGLEAYFAAAVDGPQLRREIGRFASAIGRLSARGGKPRLRWQALREESWQDAWKRFIKPRRVGKRFWVTPPWIPAPDFRGRRVITIEPGLAFGTGSHATTRGCMEYLERVAERLGPGFRALDVGTGSGILAIALALLDAGAIQAIDNDPLAVKVARANLRANGAAGRVRLRLGTPGAVAGRFDVVAANLTAETILDLAPELENKVGQRGYLVLSGILSQKAGLVRRRFAPRFRLVAQKRAREWTTLLLQRKG